MQKSTICLVLCEKIHNHSRSNVNFTIPLQAMRGYHHRSLRGPLAQLKERDHMPSSKLHPIRHLAQAGLIASLAAAGSTASAQRGEITDVCQLAITTLAAAAAAPTPVPSLSMLGVALLAAAMAFVAWRRGKFPGARFMAIALVAAAAMLANQGGGGLVQQAYAEARFGVLTNPGGETLGTIFFHGEPITFTNNSGKPLIIGSVSAPLGSCTVGSTLANGDSCSGSRDCGTCPPPFVREGSRCLLY